MKYTKITISGKICTGKTTLFWNLQNKLVWPTFSSSQFFRDYARLNTVSLDAADEQNKKLTNFVDFRMRDMLKKPGNLLAEGWMAGIMANHYKKILKVLLVCDDIVRIKRYAEREDTSLKEAKKRLQAREKNWLEKMERIYKRTDFFDPKNYDLVIDTSDMKPAAIEKNILAIIDKGTI